MYLVISYDIQSDRRRTKIHKALKNYGAWIQYSVFECHISKKEYDALRQQLDPLIDVEETDPRLRWGMTVMVTFIVP